MPRLSRPLVLIALAALSVTACATTPPPPPIPDGPGSGPVLRDWRGIVTAADRDRYERIDAAWSLALQQARRQRGSGDLASTGDLIDPDAARPSVAPPPGDYRCRTVKLGSQGGEDGLGYVVYGWFACRIEQTANGLKFIKTTGSQRPAGLLFPENDRQMVMLGSMALAADPLQHGDHVPVGTLAVGVGGRFGGERRWRLVIPWPQYESNLDLIELVPA